MEAIIAVRLMSGGGPATRLRPYAAALVKVGEVWLYRLSISRHCTVCVPDTSTSWAGVSACVIMSHQANAAAGLGMGKLLLM